ncbi:MAG: FAD-dependent oxidoreductase, partial [Brachymonas sp.]|nr:FAD-dependent oxidoreductase [Brachymonas sp.]
MSSSAYSTKPSAHIAIIGAGWAGCAAAVRTVQMGAQVSVFEASRTPGGRARSVPCADADGGQIDNGQHILIGAYSQTLALMRTVGASPEELLLRLPLDLRTPDGHGLHLRPAAFAPASAQLAALRAILQAKGWPWGEKWRLLRAAVQWQQQGFKCPAHASVADLCQGLGPVVLRSLIEPLCVAAFNSAPHETSGAVFLRVLQDALFSSPGAADALIARQPFGQLLPEPALAWLQARGARIHLGQRVMALRPTHSNSTAAGWQLQCGQAVDADTKASTPNAAFDQVILACPAWEAARLVQG